MMTTTANKAANMSACGAYRYSLSRHWGPQESMAFVMLNPSTADADIDDPTIRRCVGFAERENCGGIVVVNLYAGRATKPADLWKLRDCVGPLNREAWRVNLCMHEALIVCAWGANAREGQARAFLDFAAEHRLPLWCLGTTKGGQPRHPLYLRSDTPLERFAERITS